MTLAADERLHLRSAGELVVASVYALLGHRISWPLQAAPYDLIAESPVGGAIARVQVKTCTRKQGGAWLCWITRSEYADVPGGKRRVSYAQDAIDVLAVVDGDLQVYLIPYSLVAGQSTVTPRAYAAHRVAGVTLAAQRGAP